MTNNAFSGKGNRNLPAIWGQRHAFEKLREAWGLQVAMDRGARAIDLRVTMVLQSYLSRKNWTAFPGLRTMAGRLRVSKNAILRSIRRLEQLGHLFVERRTKENGHHQSNVYCPILTEETQFGLMVGAGRGGDEGMEPSPHVQARARTETFRRTTSADTPKRNQDGDEEMEPGWSRGNGDRTSYLTSEGTSSLRASACADAFEKSQIALQERKESEPAKPYTADHAELLAMAVNCGDMTYAGIVNATRQPGATGDGIGIDGHILRALLNDCMKARLIGTERRNGKDYFYMTAVGAEKDWAQELSRCAPGPR